MTRSRRVSHGLSTVDLWDAKKTCVSVKFSKPASDDGYTDFRRSARLGGLGGATYR